MRKAAALAVAAAALVLGLAPTSAAPRAGYDGVALNVLPPGEDGGLTIGTHSLDQLPLYDGLTPLGGSIPARDLTRFFKSAHLGMAGQRMVRTERPRGRPGLRILRDRWDVPHVYGRTRADVEFGAGWATAEDRGFLMELLRGPGRISALDVPGLDAFSLVGSGHVVASSPETEAFLAAQLQLAQAAGPRGRQLVRDAQAYVAGINAYNSTHGVSTAKWTTNDVIAIATLIGAVFGKGGGDEVRRSEFLSALETRLGTEKGLQVWNDLRERLDPEAPVTIARSFPYDAPGASPLTQQPIDDGSFVPAAPPIAAPRTPLHMSNALLVGAKRSANGHPLFVAGPQVGYYYPQILMELDLEGGGLAARGAAFPGVSLYVLLGRGRDFAWSATSANSDNVDQFVETLCGDDTHYLFKGECREMGTFDAGTLRGVPGTGDPDRRLVYRTTVHGPVIGYATIKGRRVALSSARTTRGRELLAALPFQDLNDGRVRSAKTFLQAMAGQEFVFNWFYADDRDIAMYSSGRLPLRAQPVDADLPIRGDGSNEWTGFLSPAGHAQVVDPPSGAIVNWNNKPAAGFAAADDNWSYGSVQRVDLLDAGIAARQKHTLASVVAAMNKAATQDLRVMRVLPAISAVLQGSTAPTPRAQRMLDLLEAWRANGGSRVDRDLDGKIDDPGAAVMDAAWPRLADAVMSPVLGPLVDRLAALQPRDDPPNPGGSSYIVGWYGYVDKDLRDVLADSKGQPAPPGAFATRFCGAGDLAACRASLWAALDATAAELESEQGGAPSAWRADATPERIRFAGFMPNTMRWSNRPTFQQVMTFVRHRSR